MQHFCGKCGLPPQTQKKDVLLPLNRVRCEGDSFVSAGRPQITRLSKVNFLHGEASSLKEPVCYYIYKLPPLENQVT